MPRGGHNRKPTEKKKLEGGHRKDRQKNNPAPDPVEEINPPEWLNKPGREFYERVGPEMKKYKMLTALDLDSFAELANIFGKIRILEERLQEEGEIIDDGRGSLKKHPASTLVKQHLDHYLKLAKDFGLTPESRQRLDMKEEKDPGQMDPIEKMLSGRVGQ